MEGEKLYCRNGVSIFLSFPFISIFSLGPKGMKLYAFYKLNGFHFFFIPKAGLTSGVMTNFMSQLDRGAQVGDHTLFWVFL